MAAKKDTPSNVREPREDFSSRSDVATVPEGLALPGVDPRESSFEAVQASIAAGRTLPAQSTRADIGFSQAHGFDMGLRHYLRLVFRYRRLILITFCSTMALTVARIVLRPHVYMAKATILPSGGQSQGGVLGLIASFTGVPPAGALSEDVSSLLFPSIFESRTVGRDVLEATYRFQKDGQVVETTLRKQLEAESMDKAMKVLHRMAAIDVNKETGTITVSVTTLYPELSEQVANRFVESLERVCLEMRETAAVENKSFVLDRLDKSLEELEQAEQKLTTFREQNLRMNAPELDLEYVRLQREVSLKNQIYMTLSGQAEVARIDAAKKIPIVRVLDRAAVPNLPVPVPKLTTLVLGFFVGTLCAVLAVAGVEILHYLRREIALCRTSVAEGSEA